MFRFLKRLTATPIIQAPAYFECQEKTSNLPADHVMLVLRENYRGQESPGIFRSRKP
jgi:hypothetical protein